MAVELAVEDLDSSIRFYTDVLGFELERRKDTFAAMRSGNATLALVLATWLPVTHYFSQDDLRLRKGVGAHILLDVDDVQELYRRVQSIHAPIAEPLARQPWGTTDFRIVDPDGYYIVVASPSSPE